MRGVPIVFDESQSIFSLHDFRAGRVAPPEQSRLHAFALRHLPSLELNVPARANCALLVDLLLRGESSPLVLNLGGKHGAAAAASLRSNPRVRCVEGHVGLAPQTDLIVDPAALPFDDGVFDAVLADAVLEHVVDPKRVVAEIHRVLKTGGVVYSDVPFMLGVHGGRYDFERWSALAHRRLFRGFEEVRSGVSSGPAAALANSIQSFLLSFVARRGFRFAIKALCRLLLSWLKYLDLWLTTQPGAVDAALGTYFIGLRSVRILSDRELIGSYRGATPDLYGPG